MDDSGFPSSSDEELELGPRSLGWNSGKPLVVSESSAATLAAERLERAEKGLARLSQKMQGRPACVNDEMQQEIEWARQELSVASTHRCVEYQWVSSPSSLMNT